MRRTGLPLFIALLGLFAPLTPAQEAGVLDLTRGESTAHPLDALWDARAVEHLLNRAGFGARTEEIQRWVERGPEALLGWLFEEREGSDPFYSEPVVLDRAAMKTMTPQARRVEISKQRGVNRRQFHAYLSWWIDEMLRGDDVLRERMTLFWHGFFTSAMTDVQRSHAMVQQNQLLREHALGSYAELLHAILRDPAMLIYLDNSSNVKGQPNENLARELMELFSLGEGNYTERDVREAARALTGRGVNMEHEYRFNPSDHDFDEKVVLGTRGRLDGDELVDALLLQDACAKWVAGRLLEYFEGIAPSPERVATYATHLREHEYHVRPFLQRLFSDPEFYRDEAIAKRVHSPIDYLVSSCRRIGIAPPGAFLGYGAGLAGQSLLDPPSVKGWDEGLAWISTSTLMLRGNLIGILLGATRPEDLDMRRVDDLAEDARFDPGLSMDADDGEGTMMGAGDVVAVMDEAGMAEVGERLSRGRAESGLEDLMRLMKRTYYQPRLNLTARLARRRVVTDKEIVEVLCAELLAVDVSSATHAALLEFLDYERSARKVDDGSLLQARRDCEELLRDLAHLILSLPEAQLG